MTSCHEKVKVFVGEIMRRINDSVLVIPARCAPRRSLLQDVVEAIRMNIYPITTCSGQAQIISVHSPTLGG